MDEFQLNTPVCLIIFKRPDTTEKVFEAIRKAKPPKLLVVANAPRPNQPEDVAKCAAAQAIINQVDWNCEVLRKYSDTHLDSRKQISGGLNWVFDLVEEAIILEDDCVPHPTFFRFCEELLDRYRDHKQIMTISGDNFQFGRQRQEYSYYFSRYNHGWGWATWRRAWRHYDNEMQLWPKVRDSNWLVDILQDTEAAIYWSSIFQSVYDGFKTWDFPWTFANWIQNGLTILPNVNLVSNIGFGPEATHSKDESKFANIPTEEMTFPLQHPPSVIRDAEADDFIEKTMFSGNSKIAQAASKDFIQQLIAQLNANNNTEALNLVEKQIISCPDEPGFYYAKALVLTRLGHINEAVESLKYLLTAVPYHKEGKQLLEYLTKESMKAKQP